MEEQIQDAASQMIGKYGWMFLSGMLFLLFKSSMESMIEGFKVYIGDDLNTDDVIANAGPTITDPEILGAGHANTYYRDSGTAMGGTSVDIKLGDTGGAAGTVGYTYYNEPTTTIVGTSAVCAYICNAGTSNGTLSGSTSAIVEVVIEYY